MAKKLTIHISGGLWMATDLKIVLGGTREYIKPFWQPFIVTLGHQATGNVRRYAVEDPLTDLVDDTQLQAAVYRITNLPAGDYDIAIMDSHQGNRIVHDPSFAVDGAEIEFKATMTDEQTAGVTFQANTAAMDFVADAPFRLQNTYPYLPVVINLKDQFGTIRINTVEIAACVNLAENQYQGIGKDGIFRVTDQNGKQVLNDGRPAILDFDTGQDYETAVDDPWYRLVLLHRNQFPVQRGKHLGYEDIAFIQFRVKLKFRRLFFEDEKRFIFRTIVSPSDLPEIEGWCYGDAHYHSNYTDNPYEYGGPLPVTAEMAAAIGLSWVAVTDHSYGLSRPKTEEEEVAGNRWHSRKKEIDAVNSQHDDILLIGAEEITVKKPIPGLHILSYGNPFIADQHAAGFGTYTMKEAFDQILDQSNHQPGIVFAAHPASESYAWEDGDYDIARRPEYAEMFAGLQIFNEKILYQHTTSSSMDRETVNPFLTLTEDKRRSDWSRELITGINEHWVQRFLVPSLARCRQGGTLRKCFVLAGSDAHMDFNYAFRPHPAFLIHRLYDNAFGKVRTLARLSAATGSGLNEQNVLRALKTGNTLLTDGPLALFSLTTGGNPQVASLGGTITLPPGAELELSLIWSSSVEFGPVNKIALYLGTADGEDEITSRIPGLGDEIAAHGYQGSLEHTFRNWSDSPAYLRLEACSSGQSPADDALFYCVTNPIWILAP